MTSQDTELIRKVKELEQRLGAMERYNQARRIISNGATIIDEVGLNSLSNFKVGTIFNGSANLNTTSGSMVDVAGSSLLPLVLERDSNLIFYIMGYGLNNNFINSDGNHVLNLSLYDSFTGGNVTNLIIPGHPVTNVSGGGAVTETVAYEMKIRTTMIRALAGTHNYKLQYQAYSGGTAYLFAYELGYVVLGV